VKFRIMSFSSHRNTTIIIGAKKECKEADPSSVDWPDDAWHHSNFTG
jgi:hypothetical protein